MAVAQSIPHVVSGVQIFPSDNIWNRPILDLPVHAQSAAWIQAILAVNGSVGLELKTSNTGSNGGIPYNVVNNATPTYNPTLVYAAEAYTGPFPIPANPLYEEPGLQGSDNHLLCLNTNTKVLYELVGYSQVGNAVSGSSAWNWDLTKNDLPQPFGWELPAAATAASLSAFVGLAFYDEIAAGAITHALYFCLPRGAGYGNQIWPAVHGDGNQAGYPPEGTRFRLKASVDISGFSATNQIILKALKTYGALNCDSNSGSLRMQGVPDVRWNLTDLANLAAMTANNFEIVDQSSIMVTSTTAQAIGVRAFSGF